MAFGMIQIGRSPSAPVSNSATIAYITVNISPQAPIAGRNDKEGGRDEVQQRKLHRPVPSAIRNEIGLFESTRRRLSIPPAHSYHDTLPPLPPATFRPFVRPACPRPSPSSTANNAGQSKHVPRARKCLTLSSQGPEDQTLNTNLHSMCLLPSSPKSASQHERGRRTPRIRNMVGAQARLVSFPLVNAISGLPSSIVFHGPRLNKIKTSPIKKSHCGMC